MVANLSREPANQADFRLGPWNVSPSRGRVSLGRRRHRLEPRVMQVLVVLAEARGETVARARMVDEVWRGAAVTDDAITRCVSRLRRVFSEGGVAIETIPKVGYRLTVVEASTPPEPHRGRLRLEGPFIAVAVLAVVAVLVVDWVIGRANRTDVVPSLPRPLTTAPGAERHPALSPAGGQVAFAWKGEAGDNWDVYVQPIPGGRRLRLTSHAARDFLPVWSPDGAQIAFVRRDGPTCEIRLVPATGGADRRLAECGAGGVVDMDFAPGGAALAFTARRTDEAPGRAFRLDVATGEVVPLVSPVSPLVSDESVRYAPDGRLAISRSPALGVEDIWVLGDDGLRSVTTDRLKIHGLDWAPDGQQLVVASNRGGAFALWRVYLDGRRPQVIPGTEGAASPSVGPDGRIVFEAWRSQTGLRRLDLASGDVTPMLPSTRFEWDPSLSPDGQSLAFVSDRTGSAEVWRADLGSGSSAALTEFGGPYTHTPRWSPDGRRLAFATPADGNFDVYVMDADGGGRRRLTDHAGQDFAPAWSPSGDTLYFGSTRSGGWQIWSLPADDPRAEPSQLTPYGGRAAQMTDDALWYVKAEVAGLWRMRPGTNEEQRILRDLQPVDWNNWQVVGRTIYYVRRPRPSAPELVRYDLDSGTREVLAPLPDLLHKSGLWISPDGRHAWYTDVEATEADLVLVPAAG